MWTRMTSAGIFIGDLFFFDIRLTFDDNEVMKKDDD